MESFKNACAAAVVAIACGIYAQDEIPIASAEFGLGFDSRFMTYGVIDGKDPIFVPNASLTLCDWAYFGIEAIYDATKGNGKRGGYGNRTGKYTTLDSSADFRLRRHSECRQGTSCAGENHTETRNLLAEMTTCNPTRSVKFKTGQRA